jgi:hypothetical protein
LEQETWVVRKPLGQPGEGKEVCEQYGSGAHQRCGDYGPDRQMRTAVFVHLAKSMQPGDFASVARHRLAGEFGQDQ